MTENTKIIKAKKRMSGRGHSRHGHKGKKHIRTSIWAQDTELSPLRMTGTYMLKHDNEKDGDESNITRYVVLKQYHTDIHASSALVLSHNVSICRPTF